MSLSPEQLTRYCSSLQDELTDVYEENIRLNDKIANLTEKNQGLLTDNASYLTVIKTQQTTINRGLIH